MIGLHLRGSTVSRRPPAPIIGRRKVARGQDFSLIQMPTVQQVFNPVAVMLMGPRGRGKTLALNALGAMMRQRYIEKGFDCKVFANFPTVDADISDPRVVDWATGWEDQRIRNGLLEADEIQGEAASAKWNTQTNFNLVQALTQVRKRLLETAFTTQYPRGIEKGLLEQVDFFVEVRKLGDGYGLVFAIHDWKELLTENVRRHRPWPPFWTEADWYYTWFGTKQFFGNYATFGAQVPRYMAQKDRERWERITQDEWRRHGYELAAVDDDEGLEDWAQVASSGRIEAPRMTQAEALGWREQLQQAGEFSIFGTHVRMADELPSTASTVKGFRKLLENEGFSINGDIATAPEK